MTRTTASPRRPKRGTGRRASCPAAPPRAGSQQHRHDVLMRAPAADAPARTRYNFYPDEIGGGVSGNLPFNTQLRKLADPLDAYGAGR